jgi:hypothetical protein
LGVVDPGGGVEKDAGVMAGRIPVEVPDDFFGRVVQVAMDEGEKPEACDEDQPSLGAFKQGDHPQTDVPRFPPAAAIWVSGQFFPEKRILLSTHDSITESEGGEGKCKPMAVIACYCESFAGHKASHQ